MSHFIFAKLILPDLVMRPHRSAPLPSPLRFAASATGGAHLGAPRTRISCPMESESLKFHRNKERAPDRVPFLCLVHFQGLEPWAR